ncbi:hypothetical protein [Staphylococcus phage LSA2302]|nr:hypothetical protein [Staphylococcus phage LSA2302]
MNKVLEFVMYYVMYLVIGFFGVWVGSVFIGVPANPFTVWVPYVLALVFALYEVKISK